MTVVVGIDGSPGARAALRFALAEARLRGARLVCVHAFRLPLAEGLPGPFFVELPSWDEPSLEDLRAAVAAEARNLLAAELARLPEAATRGVEVVPRPVEGAPAEALLGESAGAELLVVGARGRHGLPGLRLGSVASRCAQRATCPVAIVPASRGGV